MRGTILLLVLYLCRNEAAIPESDGGNAINGKEQPPEWARRGMEKLKETFVGERGVQTKVNQTLKYSTAKFDVTIPMKHEGVDVTLELKERESYFGHKIDIVDYKSNWTNNFTYYVDANIDYIGRKEGYKIDIIGTVDGKQVNETGKLILLWDKIRLNFVAECEESLFLFRTIAAGFDCVNPNLKTEGLSIGNIFEKPEFYSPIFDRVVQAWREDLSFGKSSPFKQIGDFSTCVKNK